MRRLGILLAAMIVLAVAAAPLQATGGPCPCPPGAADCPCHAGACDLFGPPSPCHCPTGTALLATPAFAFEPGRAHDRWPSPRMRRLHGLSPVPPLRPPIRA